MDPCFLFLFGGLAAIITVFFLPRYAIFGPAIFFLVGAACGVSLAMVTCYNAGSDRVHIEHSFPLFIVGGAFGLFPGALAKSMYVRHSSLRMRIEVFSVTLLFAAAGAPLGWM